MEEWKRKRTEETTPLTALQLYNLTVRNMYLILGFIDLRDRDRDYHYYHSRPRW